MSGLDKNVHLLLRGDEFKDLSGYAKKVTGTNTQIVNRGRFGKSFKLEEDSSINVDIYVDYISFNSYQEYTIDFRIELDKYPIDSNYSKVMESSPYGDHYGFSILIDGETKKLSVQLGAYNSYESLYSKEPLELGKEYHVAIVHEKNYYSKLYLDGIFQAEVYYLQDAHNHYLTIGKHGEKSNGFNGIISELRISNVARWNSDFTPPTSVYDELDIRIIDATNHLAVVNVVQTQKPVSRIEFMINGQTDKSYVEFSKPIFHEYNLNLFKNNENDKVEMKIYYGNDSETVKTVKYNKPFTTLTEENTYKDITDRINDIHYRFNDVKRILVEILKEKKVKMKDTDTLRDLINRIRLL